MYRLAWWTLTEKDTELFTKSKRILQEFCRGKDCFSANDLKELIGTWNHGLWQIVGTIQLATWKCFFHGTN
jgi:hypothetical protein